MGDFQMPDFSAMNGIQTEGLGYFLGAFFGFFIVFLVILIIVIVLHLMNLWHLIMTDSENFRNGREGKKNWYLLFFIVPLFSAIPFFVFLVMPFNLGAILYYFFSVRKFKKTPVA